ncbi:MAG: primosomal protein N', partial [bacterium]|nr:primosomal protein N' [bacterium]
HYCGLTTSPIEYCTSCVEAGDKEPGTLTKKGSGTEKIFEEICDLFPDAKVDRLDRDTVGTIDSYKDILNRVRSGETSILVGTQMIAKGHDLPNVTLVGVIDCDVGLHMPDFRAAERGFQLLTQVAGRAGRGKKPGTVILQTRIPHHPSIKKTVEDDYIGFAKIELSQRQKLEYPPFVRLLRIVASSEDVSLLSPFLESLKEKAKHIIGIRKLDVKLLGPSPAPLQKLKSLWRWHMLLKSKSSVAIHSVLNYLQSNCARDKKIRVIFDVDPQDML